MFKMGWFCIFIHVGIEFKSFSLGRSTDQTLKFLNHYQGIGDRINNV